MKVFSVIALIVASFGAFAEEEESAHDIILKVNEQALEEGLAFGSIDQPPLIEGDIIDDDDTRQKMEAASRGGAAAFDALNGGKWQNGVVPYVFGNVGSRARSQILKAVEEYKRKTCIKFIPRTNQRDYVIFNARSGCYSQIGRTGRGRQEISIGRGCESMGTVIHEMMHAIGFFHEQSRRDRDNYVKIYWNNISSNMKFNFNMYRQGQADTHNEPYDKQSVMHYSRYSFSINRRPTIVSKTNENERLGNNYGFTDIDVRQINKHYGCSGGGPNPPTTGKPVPPTDCKDISQVCADHKHKCQTNDFVARRCQKTCGFC
ncbi:hatching enzyme 1.2-like [Rhopilema esculentum]|uniref:hatching enzyme 1.2-like n=1 Tax=Rhopilema esculentum TaxID=499914 RepID=UPI0031CF9BD0|eukprot:gene821-10562_t